MFRKIKNYFEIKHAIKKTKKERDQGSYADRLMASTCQWVELNWAGGLQKFLIHKIDFQELLLCGRFPNVLLQFSSGIQKQLNNKEDKEERPPVPEADLQKVATEEREFMEELFIKSLLTPSYKELEKSAREKLQIPEGGLLLFKDFIPDEARLSLFLWYVKEWEEDIKKKFTQASLKDLGELPKSATKPPVTTSKD